ncbi:hypothetical protein EI42_05577 [Thermosporothrix hazakensis]|jgi:hypothetical protein|uniref:Uncharacterized protein n=1 Tax=Thermosporothrix hazakensis TaxID=644383 RepID=A0A326U1M8_THEHA|nr:hypothetical protein [Thermosporothrix hazakensis]PZW22176.1 hypothetical protein EI42_05577 [Thermosporothrix hazakensis]GCE48101.1 hypothetical protein KTH_29700 [Thermosporothrix hazakensis]
MKTSNSGKTAALYGLVTGAISGVFILTLARLCPNLLTVVAATGTPFPVTYIPILTSLLNVLLMGGLSSIAYGIAGILATKKTGELRTGIQAGLWASVAFSLLYILSSLFFLFLITIPLLIGFAGRSAQGAIANSIVALLLSLIVWVIVGLGLGAGFGALGGLISKGRRLPEPAPPPQEPYAEYSVQEQVQRAYPNEHFS